MSVLPEWGPMAVEASAGAHEAVSQAAVTSVEPAPHSGSALVWWLAFRVVDEGRRWRMVL